MARKIYLNGEMSNKFGTVHPFVGDTVHDAIRLINANNPEFKPYLIKCMEDNIDFSITVHGKELVDARECLLPLKEGDIIITPIPAGSKSGGAKILAAAAIAILLFTPAGPALWAAAGLPGGSAAVAAGTGMEALAAAGTFGGYVGYGASLLAIQLAVAGIQQLMAPDPATDQEDPEGYMLSGSQQNIVAGDPVPILYGELRVPGQPVSFEVKNTRSHLRSEVTTWDNDLLMSDDVHNDPMTMHEEGKNAKGEYLNTHREVIQEWGTTYGSREELYGRSQDMLITDIISEGPIYGLVNASSSVYLNGDSAVDVGDAAVNATQTAARFVVTDGDDEVTFKQNDQSIVIPQSDSPRYLNITDYKTQEDVTTVKAASMTASYNSGIKITTDAGFFPAPYNTSPVTNNAWGWQGGNPEASVTFRLSLDGVVKFTGHFTKFISSSVAYADSSSYNLPPQFDHTRTDYKIHVDYAVEIESVTELDEATGTQTITLVEEFDGDDSGTDGVKANVTGANRNIGDIQAGVGKSVKYDGFSCNFLTGKLAQEGFPNPGGTGLGSVAIASNYNSEITGPLDLGGDQSTKELQGTVAFGLSATQAREVDEIRVLFKYTALINTSENGNLHDGKAFYTMAMSLDKGTGFEAYTPINGRTWDTGTATGNPLRHVGQSKTALAAEEVIDMTQYQPFNDFKLKIVRLSEKDRAYYNSFSQPHNYHYTSNTQCTIGSLNSILKENLIYPYTAMAKTTINTSSFTSPPKRMYHCKGMKVQVPTNYVTRDESNNGVANYRRIDEESIHATQYQDWDGELRENLVYTNNPAWVFYDILTNSRYGLGAWMGTQDIDKFALYRIARYCDELVPDGNGGTEPRFTTNVYFRKATDAYKVLKDLATTFRGMLYWLDGNLFPVMDEPKEPVYNFTSGNVIDGLFSYESTGSKTRSNQVSVTWTNPKLNYQKEAILVEDKENIISTGRIISQNAVAFGAVSEGQAIRYGRWKLWTAKNQTEVVSFSTFISTAFLAPGDVVNIQDAARSPSKVQYSGRIATETGVGANTSTTEITLDRSITLITGSTYELSVLMEEPAVFLTQETAVITGVTYNRGDLLAGEYTESEALNIIQTTSSNAPILADGLEQPVTVAWQPHTRVETRDVSTSSGSTTDLTVSPAFSSAPASQTIWAVKETTAEDLEVHGSKKPYKILSIAESGGSKYNITAVEHYNEKFTELDKDFVLSIDDPVWPALSPSDVVPPPTNFYAVIQNLNEFGAIPNDVSLHWDLPTVSDSDVSTVYQHVKHYEIWHDIPSTPNPLKVTTNNTGVKMNVGNGVYTIGIKTVNDLDSVSVFSNIITITIGDDVNPLVQRQFGIPVGGTISRAIFLASTTGPTTHKFRITNPAYKFKAIGAPSRVIVPSNTADNNIQNISDIDTYTYTGKTETEKDLAHHYVFFDASDTSDHLKLIKYTKDTDLGINYWYDTGTGDTTASANFNVAGSGTVTIAADSERVVGTSTAFETDYNVGDIIYFSTTKAARIAHIADDEDMRIQGTFPTATSGNHYPNKFKFDANADSIIAWAENDTTDGFDIQSINLIIDETLNTRLADLDFVPSILNFDGADPPELIEDYDYLVPTARAIGFDNPEFKLIGDGFSQTTSNADSSFTNNGTNTYTRNLAKVDTHGTTDMIFTILIRETDDPDNLAKQANKTVTVPFVKAGASTYTWIKYASNSTGTADFGDTYIAGTTLYIGMAFNKVTDVESTTPGDYTWSLIEATDGLPGGSGDDGASINIVFKRAATAPSTPSNSTGSVPSGWSDDPPSGTDLLWASRGKKAVGSSVYIWTTPFQIEGEAHAEVYIYRLNNNTAPSGGSYNFTTNTLTVPSGWVKDPPSLAANDDKVYVSVGLASGANTATAATVDWGAVALYAQRTDGIEGHKTGTATLFQVNSSNSTPPGDPNGDLTYTFATGVVSGSNFNGWSNDRPDTSASNPYRWVILGPASSSGTSDIITSGDWAGAVLDSAEGYQSATVYLYQRNNNTVSSPDEPSGNLTYTFSTKALSNGNLDGWSQTIPSTGDYIHVTTAIALAVNSATSDVIASGDWADPVVLAQKGDQADGYIELNIYRRATDEPDTPTGGSYNFDTKVFTRPDDWTSYIPGGTTPAWISTGVAEMPGSTGTDTSLGWSDPASVSGEGAAGPRTSTGYVHYNTHGTPAAQPGTSATYDYDTGVVGGMTTNWQNSPPIYSSPNEDYYYASYTVTEDEYEGDETVVFGTAAVGMGFSTLVTFTESAPGGSFSHIDGGYISTDVIQSHGYTFPSGTENDPDGYSDSGMKIDLRTGKKGIRSPAFYIDAENGDAVFSGTIDGADGIFKGSLLVGTGADQFNVNTAGIYLGDAVFNNAEFSVNPAGYLKASSGNIGGWDISTTKLSGGTSASTIKLEPTTGITIGTANDIFRASSLGIQLGHDTFTSAPFHVDPQGCMTASDVTLTGYGNNTLECASIKIIGSDKVDIGNNVQLTVGDDTYNVVGSFVDTGTADAAALVGIGSEIGGAFRGAEGGLYADSGGGGDGWGWVGHSSAGVYANSLLLDGWGASINGNSSSGWLQHDGTWTTPTGTLPTQSDPGTVDKFLQSDGTDASWVTAGGTGTVTSVATGNGLTGGPITTTGTISIPDNAIGTDELNVTGDGNTLQFLRSDGDGSFTWALPAFTPGADSINDTHIDWGTGTNQVSTADVPENTNLYYTDARVNTHLNTGTASTNEVLSWNGSDYDWVAQSGGGGGGDITAVVAGTGLSGGATSGSATVNLANTAVSAGTYGSETLSAQITIDAQGRITGATNKTISGGGGDNYYLSSITQPTSGNSYTATWVMSGTTDRSIVFGANAFNSTTIPTNNNQLTNGANYTTNIGDITGVTAGAGLSGGGTSGTVTLTNSGVTSIAAGSGISVSGATGAVTVTATGGGGSGLSLGETSSTAYRGDRGKTAYDHSQAAHAPSNATDDQTAAEIIALVGTGDGKLTTKDFTAADHTKLDGIAAGATANTGDITGVTAGTGMSGGGTSGTVTLNCTIDTPAEVGLGNLSSSGNNLSGDFVATGNVTAYSDLRLKSNVNTIENGLDKVSKMRGVTYTKDFESGSGVIAQELEKIAPELVQDGKYKSVAYGNIVGYLIEAIKELKDKVEELENGNSSK
jgi:predicted phage tail protein